MAYHKDDLWQGGPWEQPCPIYPTPPPVRIPPGGEERKERYRKRRRGRRLPIFLACFVLIAGLAGLSRMLGGHSLSPGEYALPLPGREHVTIRQQTRLPAGELGTGVTLSISPLGEQSLSYTQVYEKNAQSVVTIQVQDGQGMGQGTGIVLTRDGYIITNAHVVEGAHTATVVLNDDRTYSASLVGMDLSEDLAVLKIQAKGLSQAEFGDSDLLRVGDAVSALGNPLGYRLTLTPGIISALDRQLAVEGSTMYLLQTSAAINFGNSGGALLNDRGQVVGVTTVKIISEDGSVEALGFAIPSRRVKYVVDRLIAGQEIKTPMLGITVQRSEETDGLTVLEIRPWSDAGAKGLRVGDVIVKVNESPVSTNRDLSRIKDMMDVGDSLELTVERDGELLQISVRLAEDGDRPGR